MNESIMDAAKIARINELYHKSKAEGLSDEEKAEQQQLSSGIYICNQESLRSTLNNIDIKEKDGSITKLQDLDPTRKA